MKTKYTHSAKEVSQMQTNELRENFLIEDLFQDGKISLNYLHYDRIIVGGVKPTDKILKLEVSTEIGTKFFLERRELGIINIGGKGQVKHDGGEVEMQSRDGLYLPVGNKVIEFKSLDAKNPAKFYLFSTLGQVVYPVTKVDISKSQALHLGSDAESNKRVIYQYFHPNVCKTNALLMGVTLLEPNNMWNTMPCHTHERRFEGYLYFELDPQEVVFHFMGQPQQTRHLVVKNENFVASPPWSIHTGVGTKNYAFVWAMGGENLDFTDMQGVKKVELK